MEEGAVMGAEEVTKDPNTWALLWFQFKMSPQKAHVFRNGLLEDNELVGVLT